MKGPFKTNVKTLFHVTKSSQESCQRNQVVDKETNEIKAEFFLLINKFPK